MTQPLQAEMIARSDGCFGRIEKEIHMDTQLFHIFRNTPLGRETLFQSLYFCNQTGSSLVIYIPEFTKFLMYFDNDVVQIDLDESYLTSPETACEHAEALAESRGVTPVFFKPQNFTASTLPDVPVHYDFMCCPRSISDMASKIGLGFIGSKVRRIIKTAQFPVLLTSPAYKEWKSIAVFFGGSANAVNALKLGLRLCRTTGMRLQIFTQLEGGKTEASYKEIVEAEGLLEEVERYLDKWHVFDSGRFEDNLYMVPHDALVVLGAFGHGLIRDILFGSKMEKIQSTITNNLLVAGPNYTART